MLLSRPEDEEEGAEDNKGKDLDLSTHLECVVYCPLVPCVFVFHPARQIYLHI
jgi:hypothetical protein